MTFLGHVPLVIGIALLVGAAFIMWWRPSENNPLTVMFLTGVALIFLSDQRILNLKFGTSGMEIVREKVQEARQDIGEQIAALRADIEKQKQILDQHQKLIDVRPASTGAPASPSTAAPAASDQLKKIEQTFSTNSQSLILVFYRSGQRSAAEALSAKLVEHGYKSSSIPTDLTEISVPGMSGDPKSGTVVIARANKVKASLAQEISAKVKELPSNFNLSPIVNNDEWPFKRGDIQVYMF